MNIESPATNAVAAGPMTAAPPSFVGMEWLLALNLAAATLALLVLSFAARRVWDAWRAAPDRTNSAAELMQRIVLLLFTGGALRALADSLSLYGWDPARQSSGGWATAARFLDPIGIALLVTGAVLFLLARTGIVAQLRVRPLYSPIWETRQTMRRLAGFASVSIALALVVVTLR